MPFGGPEGAPVRRYDTLGSTNAEARRLAEEGESGPLWVHALSQSAGVGRRGRTWVSPPGNLYATLLTTTVRPPAEAAQVSFLAALAVADLAREALPAARIELKWPNDVLLNGRKMSGVLVESGPRNVRVGGLWLAVGIGVNLAGAPHDVERPATSLAEEGAAPMEPDRALGALAGHLARWGGLWVRGGFPPIAEAWTARACGLGDTATARLPTETVHGTAEGLEGDGALRLRLADGSVRRISAGEVMFGSEAG